MRRTVRLEPTLEPLLEHVRPATIVLGIACFFVGTIGVGATLAAVQGGRPGPDPAASLSLLSFGVAYVGIGLVAPRTEARYDPEIGLPEWGRAVVAMLAGVTLVGGVLALSVAL